MEFRRVQTNKGMQQKRAKGQRWTTRSSIENGQCHASMPHTFAVLAAYDVSPKSDTWEVQHKPQSSNWIGEEPPRNSKRTDLPTRLDWAWQHETKSLHVSKSIWARMVGRFGNIWSCIDVLSRFVKKVAVFFNCSWLWYLESPGPKFMTWCYSHLRSSRR